MYGKLLTRATKLPSTWRVAATSVRNSSIMTIARPAPAGCDDCERLNKRSPVFKIKAYDDSERLVKKRGDNCDRLGK